MFNNLWTKKFLLLTVGAMLAIASCGIQNNAGSQDGAAPKTKNATNKQALCFLDGREAPPLIGYQFPQITIEESGLSWRAVSDLFSLRFRWNTNLLPMVPYPDPILPGPVVLCSSLLKIDIAAADGATSAEELPEAFVENSTANQCISIDNRKRAIQGYDEQIMAHSLDEDKTIYEQMKVGRWITSVQKPCTEANYTSELSSLSCVSVSYQAFEQAFWDEQYELHKEEAGTPYLDTIIINKDKTSKLATC